MSVTVEGTPNPAAVKFVVGVPVGGPATYRDSEGAEPFVAEILAIDGVTSVFMTANFVTVSATPGFDWDAATPTVSSILESAFAD